MLKKYIILFYCCCILLTCHGAIWKTEDAYIIDDIPDDDDQVATTASSNICVDTNGAQGQCVSVEECNSQYKFFTSESELEVFKGLHDYLNATDLETCIPANQDANSTTVNYVCCTTLKYANVKSITLEEYNAKDSNRIPEGELPDIPPAKIDEIVRPQIVSGDVARVGEFAYAIAIIYKGQQICGGSLIDSQWVLSAAHCFDRFNSQAVRQLVIKVGDHDLSSTRDAQHQDRLVSKLFLHPGFFRQRGFFRDDVALIKLKTPVSPGGNIRTVALHTGSPSLNGITDATVCGWGKTCAASHCGQSSVLRKTTLSLVSNSQCSQKYSGTQAPPLTNNMVCAGGFGGQDACNGDSGGPLVIGHGGQPFQIGIVSWGIGCGSYPGVYTRVSSFVNWITKHKNKP